MTRSIRRSARYLRAHRTAVVAENLRSIQLERFRCSPSTMGSRFVHGVKRYRGKKGPGSVGNRTESFPFATDRDSRDTIFQRRTAARANEADTLVRDACHWPPVPQFRLSPSERIISFHSHELSPFPLDRRLLERQIPGGTTVGSPTNSANAL